MKIHYGMRTQRPSAKSEETEITVTGADCKHTSVRRPRLISQRRKGRMERGRKGGREGAYRGSNEVISMHEVCCMREDE